MSGIADPNPGSGTTSPDGDGLVLHIVLQAVIQDMDLIPRLPLTMRYLRSHSTVPMLTPTKSQNLA
jgi:hypothetical protein